MYFTICVIVLFNKSIDTAKATDSTFGYWMKFTEPYTKYNTLNKNKDTIMLNI